MPAGEVTFRSKVARRHRVEHRDTYPPEFGVTARYKAEGQIAGPAFSDKRCGPYLHQASLGLCCALLAIVLQVGSQCLAPHLVRPQVHTSYLRGPVQPVHGRLHEDYK